MKILFSTWAWSSHYFPMVPLAQACRAAGHDVRVASQPALVAAIRSSGLPAVVVGSDVDVNALFRDQVAPLIKAGSAEPARRTSLAIGIFVRVAEAMADDLVSFTQRWQPDLVVFDPITFAAPIAAAVTGVPAVRHLFGPDFTSGGARPGAAGASAGAGGAGGTGAAGAGAGTAGAGTGTGPANGARASAGPEMPGMAALLARFCVPDLQLRGTLTVDPCPPSMQPSAAVTPREPMAYVPYNGQGVMPRWPSGPGHRVCLTWGTSTVALTGDDSFLPPAVITAAKDTGAEIVIAVTAEQRRLLPELPPGAKVLESVPLHLVLPECAAVVHQGGAGTTLTAAALGVPQVILPQLPDQRFNAQQAAATGAARCLPVADLTAESAAGSIAAVLDEPGPAAAALALRQEILAQPQPADVVGKLEALAAA
ncbi:MAG TPA: glycosyltransferase [Streptosporangiaceae bacterium]|jgi:UDP:flavonoid glycosyltransferase YjiC (YdhE family)|nr:glycosyltransferase [Streptosporangiaceae bacterium]